MIIPVTTDNIYVLSRLKTELQQYSGSRKFTQLKTMGDIVKQHLKETLRKTLYLIQESKWKSNN